MKAKGPFPTVLGDMSFDEKGDRKLPGYIMYEWKKGPDGKYSYFRRTPSKRSYPPWCGFRKPGRNTGLLPFGPSRFLRYWLEANHGIRNNSPCPSHAYSSRAGSRRPLERILSERFDATLRS